MHRTSEHSDLTIPTEDLTYHSFSGDDDKGGAVELREKERVVVLFKPELLEAVDVGGRAFFQEIEAHQTPLEIDLSIARFPSLLLSSTSKQTVRMETHPTPGQGCL